MSFFSEGIINYNLMCLGFENSGTWVKNYILITNLMHHHHHHVREGLGAFPVP